MNGTKITRRLVRRSSKALREENGLELNRVVAVGDSEGTMYLRHRFVDFLEHQHNLLR
jgi:hypothetical protein